MAEIWDLGEDQEVPFVYRKTNYVLVEAPEEAVRCYTNSMMKRTKLGPNGQPVSFDDMADLDSELLVHCVYQVEKDGRKKVGLADLRGWGQDKVRVLVKKVKEISKMEDADEGTIDKQIEELQKQKEKSKALREQVKN